MPAIATVCDIISVLYNTGRTHSSAQSRILFVFFLDDFLHANIHTDIYFMNVYETDETVPQRRKKIQFIWSEEIKRNQIKTDFAWKKRDKGALQPAPNI